MRPRQENGAPQRAFGNAREVAPRPGIFDRLDQIREDNVTLLRRPAGEMRGTASRAASAQRGARYRSNPFRSPKDWSAIEDGFDELAREMSWNSRRSNAASSRATQRALDQLGDQIHRPIVPSNAEAPRLDERAHASSVDSSVHQEDVSLAQSERTAGEPEAAATAQPFELQPTIRFDQRQFEALEAGLAAIGQIAKSVASQRESAPPQIEIDPSDRSDIDDAKPARWTRWAKASAAVLLVVSIAGAGAYVMRERLRLPALAALAAPYLPKNLASIGYAPAAKSAGDVTHSIAPRTESALPLPDVYGIYAVSSGKLIDLEALPGQAPDPRVAMSGPISRPGRVTLPDGRVSFIVFRRDITSIIAERVPVRVVARLKRGMAGEEDDAETWTIRNVSVDFSVAPIDRDRDMVLLRSKNTDFGFPPGRYALVLKGQAYDFTVAGPITDPAQCMERIEAVNGSFYQECQQAEPAISEDSSQEPAPRARPRSKPRRAAAH
jgi:hypothetical protein